MLLDYQEGKGTYVLRVPRSEGVDITALVLEHGFDYSESASSPGEAVLFTREPYAAVTFLTKDSTVKAWDLLTNLSEEVRLSQVKVSNAHIDMPEDQELWGFQAANVEYVTRRNHALVGDQPGLGKTPTAICVANEIKAKRVLVICPANIRLQWARMIRVWSTMEGRYIVYPILKSKDGVHPHAEWTIISYDLARSPAIHAALMEGLYDLVILDEVHYCKTPVAKRTKAIFGPGGLEERAGMILGLTGTPLPNRPSECYTISKGLCHDAIDWMTQDEFNHRFNPSRVGTHSKTVLNAQGEEVEVTSRYKEEKVGRLPELRNRLRANFMTRHLKRDVLDQLPQVRYEITHMEITGDIRKALEAEAMLDIDPENLAGINAQILGHISTVRMQMGIAMAPVVAQYVDMLILGGEEKLVVFGWHIGALDILEQKLHKHGVVRIDGSVPPHKRQMYVDQFIKDPKKKIMLGNLQAMGVGTDGLQAVCSHAIFAEFSWTPGDNEQGVSRLERMGQLEGILAEFMVAPGSLGERILGSSLRKLRTIHDALDREH